MIGGVRGTGPDQVRPGMPTIVKESDHVFCVHPGSPTRQRSPPSFPAFKSCDLGFVQISGVFCSSAED